MLCEAGELAVSSEMFASSLSTAEPESPWCYLIPSLLHDCGPLIFHLRMFMALFYWNLSLENGAFSKLFYQDANPGALDASVWALGRYLMMSLRACPQMEAGMLFSLASIFHLSRGESCIEVGPPHSSEFSLSIVPLKLPKDLMLF